MTTINTSNILVPQVTVEQAFLHFFYLDKANAAIHTAEVRFSPVTFRLQEALDAVQYMTDTVAAEWREVRDHNGKYDEDKGR